MASELVFYIVREHFLRDNLRHLKIRYSDVFCDYFYENCSLRDINSLFSETSLDGVMELFSYVSEHLLESYGIPTALR